MKQWIVTPLFLLGIIASVFSTSKYDGKTIRFHYPHHPGIHHVELIGNFNQWTPGKDPLILRGDSLWMVEKFLPYGKYEYRFLVNGTHYLRDPQNPNFGGVYSNSILWVLPPDIPEVTIRNPRWGSIIRDGQVSVQLQFPNPQWAKRIKKRLAVMVDGRPLKTKRQGREIRGTASGLAEGLHWVRVVISSRDWEITWQDSVFFIINAVDSPAVPLTEKFRIDHAGKPVLVNGGYSWDPDFDPLPAPKWSSSIHTGQLLHDTTYFPTWVPPDTLPRDLQFFLSVGAFQDTTYLFTREFAIPHVRFIWQKPDTWHFPVHQVQLVGEFNHWQRGKHDLIPNSDSVVWHLSIPLTPGQYEYKFVVNDTLWIPDAHNPNRIPDGWNGWNSVITVKPIQETASVWKWQLNPGWIQLFPQWRGNQEKVEYLIDPARLMNPQMARVIGDTLILRHWKLTNQNFRVYALIKNQKEAVIDRKSFLIHSRNGKMRILDYNAAPVWTRTAVAYQIYLRRFGPDSTHSGTFQDLINRLDYLQDLGVNTVWLMPIMPSSAPHGYTPTNHFAVSPDYGTMKDFRRLIAALHQRGMRFIFDFVANHTGDQHPFFKSAWFNLQSPFRNWYIWHGRWQYAYHNDWDALPNLNYQNPNVRHYMLEVAKFWLERGVDGFRCDAAWGVPHDFWKQFRWMVKKHNPDAVLIDEVLPRDPSFHQEEFDMSYDTDFYGNLLDVMRSKKPVWVLRYGLRKTQLNYPAGIVDFRYLENQDLPRFIQQFGPERTRIAAAFLLTVPGMPLIYYGQELGVQQIRPHMPWHAVGNSWYCFYKTLIALRHQYSQLTEPDITFTALGDSTKVLSYIRGKGSIKILVVLNFSDTPVDMDYTGITIEDVVFRWPSSGLSLRRIPPYGIFILKVNSTP